ncbi:hypothetical protein SAMN05421665_0628 [Yoonia rosea]|uniref:Porin n=1 Tax=Yoonia rosea TaxID=287098 RepID=A0A1R3WIH5_9RHOB|nr:Lpg1974 family pore-forming outer membrane protein [Yoonia rosea]SIT77718.1 hypothetical protein SAMN05421665_0628 [Yoonia rosea]
MKPSLISTTSWFAILTTISSGAFAGGVADAITEPAIAAPAATCLGGPTLDLRAGILRSDNVLADDTASLDDNFSFEDANLSDKLGLGDAEGGFGAGQFTWDRCGSDIAVGAGFASTSMEETEAGVDFFGEVAISDDVDFQFVDVEYGRPIGDKVRGFLGLRVLNFESDSAFSTEGDLLVSEATFTGIGPRAGAEFNTSTGQAGSFGVFGGASAALLYGERTNEVGGSIIFEDPASNSESSNEAVLNFEAELGVAYNITDAAAVKLGMNYMQINDMDWASGTDFVADIDNDGALNEVEAGDRSFVGAFVGLEIAF